MQEVEKSEPEANAQPSEPKVPACRKCGSFDSIRQFRMVHVTVGWNLNKFSTPAPCRMCKQCGDVTVAVSAETGDFLPMSFNAGPTEAQKEQLNRQASIAGEQIDEAIDGLKGLKQAANKRASKKRVSKKKASKRGK